MPGCDGGNFSCDDRKELWGLRPLTQASYTSGIRPLTLNLPAPRCHLVFAGCVSDLGDGAEKAPRPLHP